MSQEKSKLSSENTSLSHQNANLQAKIDELNFNEIFGGDFHFHIQLCSHILQSISNYVQLWIKYHQEVGGTFLTA